MARFETRYTHGDVLFLRVNGERKPGMVTGISIKPGGAALYEIGWCGGTSSWHFELELSTEYVPEWAGDERQRQES